METEKIVNRKADIALILAAIALGVSVIHVAYIAMQPTIYDKLTASGITYILSDWNSNLLANRTYVHQFQDYLELEQFAEMLKIVLDRELVVNIDKTYNIIWRTDPTNEGWISIVFYTEPD